MSHNAPTQQTIQRIERQRAAERMRRQAVYAKQERRARILRYVVIGIVILCALAVAYVRLSRVVRAQELPPPVCYVRPVPPPAPRPASPMLECIVIEEHKVFVPVVMR